MAPRARLELEPVCGRERSGSAQAKSRAKRGICLELRRQRFWKLAPRARFELEPVCGRERSGSPQAKSRAKRGICLELRRRRFWKLAPRARFELATFRLTAERSTVELPGSSLHLHLQRQPNLKKCR